MALREEYLCAICLEPFRKPVTIDCGHNFCQDCLARCWGERGRDACCPQCREPIPPRRFWPNWQLASIIEAVQKLELEKRAAGRSWGKCLKHQVAPTRFCQEDEALLCSVCERAQEHQSHTVVPVEDVAPEYQEKFEAYLNVLEQRRNHLESLSLAEHVATQKCLKLLEMENQKISSAFDELQNFLQGKKFFWLGQLQYLEEMIKKKEEEKVSSLSEKVLHLSNLIKEMKEKRQLPANEFLQDIKSTMNTLRKTLMDRPVLLSVGLEETAAVFSKKASVLEVAMKKYKGRLELALGKAWYPIQEANKVNVTLDPDTANPCLILSLDIHEGRVECGVEEQNLPNVPQRFDPEPCVLGYNRFTSGSQWWEVEVQKEGPMWTIGIARERVRRKGNFIPNTNEGIWAIGKASGDSFSPLQVWAFTAPKPTLLTLRDNPKKICVSLDYEEGRVEFFDACTHQLIFSFPSTSFSGETIRPFFWVEPGVRLKC